MVALKYILMFFLGLWLIRSILRGLLVRVISRAQQRNFRQQQSQQRRARTGDTHVDFNPGSRKNKTSDDYKGGDYIDYEEVD